MAKSTSPKKAATKAASKKAATPAKKATPGKDKPIKYTDKSPGQPQLMPIFEQLKKLITPYAKGSLVLRDDQPGTYGLWSDKEIELKGRKLPGVFFVGLMVQKGYVGFYFMPVYTDPSLKSKLPASLVKCLKGKSCFHIKKNDPQLMEEIKEALKIGYEDYKKKGWAS